MLLLGGGCGQHGNCRDEIGAHGALITEGRVVLRRGVATRSSLLFILMFLPMFFFVFVLLLLGLLLVLALVLMLVVMLVVMLSL